MRKDWRKTLRAWAAPACVGAVSALLWPLDLRDSAILLLAFLAAHFGLVDGLAYADECHREQRNRGHIKEQEQAGGTIR